MLIEFSVSNFRSIAGVQQLSFSASSLKEASQNQCFSPVGSGDVQKLTLLKSAVIYGANAAGKSNIIKALGAMRSVVLNSAKSGQRGDALPLVPFKLDVERLNKPSEFELVFVAQGVRYQYGFSASVKRVHEEWLFAYPKGRPQKWFSRVWDDEVKEFDWDFGTSLSGEKQVWKNSTRDNALFLSTAVQLNSEQLQPIFDWFKSGLHIIGVNGLSPAFSAQYCHDGAQASVLDFLKASDLGIEGLEIEADPFDEANLPEDLPQGLREVISAEMKDKKVFEVKTLHRTLQGMPVPFELDDESTGSQKLFAFAGSWLDVLKMGSILVVDELHDNLHPKLVQYLVELFHNPKTNPKNAQLIFTTHETSILNQDVFRRDQIWFCEKDELQSTLLFPLTDFSPRKGRENLETAYLAGRYGAVPFIEEFE